MRRYLFRPLLRRKKLLLWLAAVAIGLLALSAVPLGLRRFRPTAFISMLLVTCVAVPLVWLGVIVSSDALVTLLSASGDGMGIKVIFGTMSKALAEFHSENVSIGIVGPWATYLSWCGNILTFTLGAIFFRKNKIVLTILSVIGICILLVVAGGIVFGGEMHIEPADINEDSLMRLLNCVIYGLYFVEFTLLNLGIYFRIKTLKH